MVRKDFVPSPKLKRQTARFKKSLNKDIDEAKGFKTLKAKKEAAEMIITQSYPLF